MKLNQFLFGDISVNHAHPVQIVINVLSACVAVGMAGLAVYGCVAFAHWCWIHS